MTREDPDVNGPTKADLTLERIRRDLVTGELVPGAHLKIHELQERYDVSQTTIREVLPKLVNEGLLVSKARRGYVVNDLSISDLDDLVSLRLDLELPAFREAIENGDVDWEVGILRSQHLMRKFVSEQDGNALVEQTHGWLGIHANFHAALIAGCRSERRKQYCRHLFDQSSRYFVVAANYLPSSEDNLQEHVELGDLALSRDMDNGIMRLRQHIKSAHLNMQRFLFADDGSLN